MGVAPSVHRAATSSSSASSAVRRMRSTTLTVPGKPCSPAGDSRRSCSVSLSTASWRSPSSDATTVPRGSRSASQSRCEKPREPPCKQCAPSLAESSWRCCCCCCCAPSTNEALAMRPATRPHMAPKYDGFERYSSSVSKPSTTSASTPWRSRWRTLTIVAPQLLTCTRSPDAVALVHVKSSTGRPSCSPQGSRVSEPMCE